VSAPAIEGTRGSLRDVPSARGADAATLPSQYDVTNEERATNRRVALLVPLLPLVFIVAVGAVCFAGLAVAGSLRLGLVIVAASVVLGGLVVAAGILSAPANVERLLGAHRVPDGTQPRIENLVEGLCATLGVSHPPLFVLDDDRVNLAMVATGSGAAMIVTTALVKQLDLIELEGVLAHGLAHLRLDDVRRGTLAATLPSVLGNDVVRHRLAGRGRLLRADEVAAASVRYPVGIAAVLDRCIAQPPPKAGSYFATDHFGRTRWLWFDPLPGDPSNDIGEVDAPAVRAQALAEW
jgi:Zn-dependent protease with chaperone function